MGTEPGPRVRPEGTTLSGRDQGQLSLQFASHAAHEIAGPINQVSSLVALFTRRYRGKLDDDADKLLAHIESAGTRLGNTATGLRQCFEVCTADCGQAPVDMNVVLDAALASLRKQISECGAEVRADTLPVVEGDRDLLILLLQALVGNALKFRRAEAPPRVVVTAEQGPQAQAFCVSDNGIGIEPQYCEVVFQAFKKLNGHSYPGAGLGLTLAQLIVGLHGGRIWIEPAPAGTCVYFELPSEQ